MRKIANLAFIAGSLTMLTTLILIAAGIDNAKLAFLVGSIVTAFGRFASYQKTDDIVLRRLMVQQMLASVLFVGTGALMLTTLRGNEWIGCLCIATVLEMYSAFRISHIEKRNNNS